MSIRRKLSAIAGSLIIGVAGWAAVELPAWAYPTINVCNNTNSYEPIRAYNNDTLREYLLSPGWCANVDDTNGSARVDVDPAGGHDVDSYRYYKIGGSSSGCILGENGSANPYGPTKSPYGTGYQNYYGTNCT